MEPFTITRKDVYDCVKITREDHNEIQGVCDFRQSQYFCFLSPLSFYIKEGEKPFFPHDSDALSVSFFLEYLKCDGEESVIDIGWSKEDTSVDLFPALMHVLLKTLCYNALRQLASWTGHRNFKESFLKTNSVATIVFALKPFLESVEEKLLKSAYTVLRNLNIPESDVFIPLAIAHLQTQHRCTQTYVASFLKTKTKEAIGENLGLLREMLSRRKTGITVLDWLRHFLA